MNYKKAISRITSRYKNERTEGELLYRKLVNEDETLRDLDRAMRKETLNFDRENDEIIHAVKRKIDQRLKDLQAFDAVYPPPHCAVCQDSGFDEGKPCSCVKREALRDEAILLPLRKFSELDKDFGNQTYQNAANVLTMFAQKYPATRYANIVLMGKPGTGKTVLSACLASAVLDKGFSVVSLTAFEMSERMLKYHTTFDASKLSHLAPLLDCDVLVIDDLGSESVFRNVTVEYFYHIVNERQLRNRLTVVTSNLNIDQLAARYGERTISRLFDKKVSLSFEFDFEDSRKLHIQ